MCHVSQPTVSSGIARLEELTGQLLFNRSNRRVELTAAGARLVPHARRIESEFIDAQQAVAANKPVRLIRIGIATTIAPAMIEAILKACSGNGDTRLEVIERRPSELAALLDRRRADILLGPYDPHPNRKQVRLFEEPYQLALSQDHSLALNDVVTCEQLVDQPMLVRRQCEALPIVSQFFTARGVRPFMAARTADEERAACFVRFGLGITIIPRSLKREGIVVRYLAGFDLKRTVGLSFDPASEHRLSEGRIIERIVENLGELL
jgi:DNA-binding transcriptional LysR family regulator